MCAAKSLPEDLQVFLDGQTDSGSFHHADHVRMAFEILRRHDFPTAVHAYCSSLKKIAARAGRPAAYHETITVAFLALVGERLAECAYDDFAAFAAANPDLMEKAALEHHYAPERIRSEIARTTFVLP